MARAYELIQTLELGVSDGPKQMKQKEAKFRELWQNTSLEDKRGQNAAGHTVLHIAVLYGYRNLVKDLIKELPELVMRRDVANGDYPVHIAVLGQQLDVAEVLLNIAGVPHLKNHKNQTPIHYAAQYGSQDMADLCAKKCMGSINQKDRLGKTPLDLARLENTPDVEAVLVGHGALPGSV